MEYVIETKNLSKKFKTKLAANNVNMHIEKGSIYGFIGKNGAGKTTVMKLILGLLRPSAGEITINGSDELNKERAKIGSLIEDPGIYKNCTAFENMKRYAILFNTSDEEIRELLKLVELDKTGKKVAGQFSLGMKQRLGIAISMLGHPEILILDEPINGLDPQGIVEIRELLIKLNQERGTTIIISSHILTELSKLATEYAFIENGRIVEELSREELENNSRGKLVIKCEDANAASKVLKDNGFSDFEIADNETIFVYDKADVGPVMNMKICQAGIMVKSFNYEVADLEEYFLKIIKGIHKKGSNPEASAASGKEVV